MPGEESWKRMTQVFKEKGYDDETIEYLLTESGGLNNYSNIGYIRMPFLDRPLYRKVSEDAAKFFNSSNGISMKSKGACRCWSVSSRATGMKRTFSYWSLAKPPRSRMMTISSRRRSRDVIHGHLL